MADPTSFSTAAENSVRLFLLHGTIDAALGITEKAFMDAKKKIIVPCLTVSIVANVSFLSYPYGMELCAVQWRMMLK